MLAHRDRFDLRNPHDCRDGPKAGERAARDIARTVPREDPGSPIAGPYDRVMLLAIDIGNTNITLGLVRDGALVATRRATTRATATPDELEAVIEGLLRLEGLALERIRTVALASVVPGLTAALEAIATRRGQPLIIAAAGTVPIPVRVDRPGEVGADRLVNALAAGRLHGAPAVVVDFGTATTFDCVGPDGAYVGGAIAPGLELGLEALAARTAKLPRIELRTPDRAIGRDTVSAMQSGTIFGYQALASGLLARVRRELAESAGVGSGEVRAILTGGLAGAPWARDVEGVDAIDPDLTLKGLAILHAEVAGGPPFTGGGR
jgi:type III pantothenate kinase